MKSGTDRVGTLVSALMCVSSLSNVKGDKREKARMEFEREAQAVAADLDRMEAMSERIDALKIDRDMLHSIVDALPKCDDCGATATHTDEVLGGGLCYVCDTHAESSECFDELPYAVALRAYLETE